MNYIKKITLLCVPWLLAACGTIPISQPVEDATRPTVSEPQEKPIKAPEPLVTPQKAPVASAAQAPAVVLSLLRRAEQQGRVGKDAGLHLPLNVQLELRHVILKVIIVWENFVIRKAVTAKPFR